MDELAFDIAIELAGSDPHDMQAVGLAKWHLWTKSNQLWKGGDRALSDEYLTPRGLMMHKSRFRANNVRAE